MAAFKSNFTPFILMFCCICQCMIITTIFSCTSSQQKVTRKIIPKPKKIINQPKLFSLQKEIQKSFPASLTVFSFDLMGKLNSHGSATVLKCKKGEPIIALTSLHVVEGIIVLNPFSTIMIGRSHPTAVSIITVEKKDIASDLAILVGTVPEKQDCSSVSITTKEPKLGSDIWIIGTPRQYEGNITRGVLSCKFKKYGVNYYRTDTVIFYGNSGGGAFNSHGELIGVAWGMDQHWVSTSDKKIRAHNLMPGGTLLIGWPTVKKFLKDVF